ncbi:MAG: sulfatase-like hydrolase/transferase [Acidobacteria bacterium]|nr:sulfatase-like hydrolase/transferase [Acidobacteriota bacterium]
MTRRTFLHAAGTAPAVAGAPLASRPNVLMIMFDQWRFDCLGAHGNRLIRTPNLDHLAARSANFTNAFIQAPVCVPSRISYFTGRYPHSHRNRVNYTPYTQTEPMMQRILQGSGFRTGSVGKLHFSPPTVEHARQTGFDQVLLDDGIDRTDPYSDYVQWRKEHDPKANVPYQRTVKGPAPGKNPFRAIIGKDYTPTAWTGTETRRTLRNFAAAPEPFFLFSSFFKPHAPYTIPAPYDSLYDHIEIPLPRPVDLGYIRQLPPPVQKMILRFTPQYDTDRNRLQWMYRSYYAAVTMLDDEVGAILDTLQQSGKADQTIVLVVTDHGDQMLEHGLFGKNVFFESSVHVPMMVCWPGHVRPGTYVEMVESVDVLPTLVELCGLTVPECVQGNSFAPLIAGDRSRYSSREMVFAENVMPEVITNGDSGYSFVPGKGVDSIRHPDGKMVRTKRWKLNYYPGNGGELYDLDADPGEWNNLYRHPDHRSLVNDLKGQILDWLITADENDQIARRWLI